MPTSPVHPCYPSIIIWDIMRSKLAEVNKEVKLTCVNRNILNNVYQNGYISNKTTTTVLILQTYNSDRNGHLRTISFILRRNTKQELK